MAFAVDEQIADATGLTIQFEVFTKRVKTGILKKSLSALMKKKAAKGKPPAAATEETPKEPAEKEPKAEDKEPPKEPAEKEPKAEDKEPVASAEEVVPLAAAAPKAKGKAKARAATLKLSAEDQVAVEMATESWTEDNLRPQFRSEFAKAKGGVGVCSKCRWSSGCIRCSEDKAWSYWVRRELGFDNSKAIVAKHAKK